MSDFSECQCQGEPDCPHHGNARLSKSVRHRTLKQFCEWQIKAKEDTDDTWTCCAHLAEGHVLQCPHRSLRQAQTRRYPCVDATPVKRTDSEERP